MRTIIFMLFAFGLHVSTALSNELPNEFIGTWFSPTATDVKCSENISLLKTANVRNNVIEVSDPNGMNDFACWWTDARIVASQAYKSMVSALTEEIVAYSVRSECTAPDQAKESPGRSIIVHVSWGLSRL
jgi:hypothetical protein